MLGFSQQSKLMLAALFTPGAQKNVTGDVTRWGLPVIIVGEPGIAKSAVVEALAEQYQLPCEVLSPGERGEAAFGAVPVPLKDKDGQVRMHYPAPEWTQRMTAEAGGVVFVDEANTGGPALQPPLMGLIQARRIGGTTLHARVRVMAAMNPPEIAANGYDLAAPIANRFGWIDWCAPTPEDHRAYMLGTASVQKGLLSAADLEESVLDRWGQAFAEARGLETSFLCAQADWKNKCPKASEPAVSRAWPSDRSWENATRAYAGAKVHGLTQEELEVFVSAFVGAKAAEAWFTYIGETDMPNIADLLDGKVAFKFEKSRLDRTAAVLNSATALVTNAGCVRRKERAEALWEILGTVDGSSRDLVLPANEALILANLHQGKAALRVMAQVNPTLNAVNAVAGKR